MKKLLRQFQDARRYRRDTVFFNDFQCLFRA